MARRDLTDKAVAALRTGKTSTVSDPRTKGLCVRIRGNSKTWQVVCRDPGGKIIWRSIGDTNLISIAEARAEAARDCRGDQDRHPARQVRCARDVR